MSYCRMSSDAGRSNVYCYALDAEYIICVGYPSPALSADGKTIICNSLSTFKDWLLRLRKMGYHIPDKVFARINRELGEVVPELYLLREYAEHISDDSMDFINALVEAVDSAASGNPVESQAAIGSLITKVSDILLTVKKC